MSFVIVTFCIILSAFLSAAEIAFVTARRSQIRELARSGHARAAILRRLRENPERTLSVIQLGESFVTAVAATVGFVGTAEYLTPYLVSHLEMTYFTAQLLSIGVVVVGFTYLDVVFGELVPKVLALRHPLWVAILSSRFLSAFETGLRPFVSFLEWSTRTFIQIFLKPRRWRPIEENKSEFEWDVLPDAHRHLVLNAVALEKRRLQDMYLPWSEVVWVDWNQSFEEVAKIVTSSEHSRFPVLKNGNLEGIITNRDFTAAVLSGQTEWHTLLRKVCRLQQTTKLLHALKSLQGRKNQIAVVYDGSRIVGITTVRDIFEKIIGDIYDEDDVSALQHLLGSSGKIPLHPPQDSRAPL